MMGRRIDNTTALIELRKNAINLLVNYTSVNRPISTLKIK